MKKGYFYIFLLIFADQATKFLARFFYTGKEILIVDNILRISYVENRGISFGLLQGQNLLFIIVTTIALLFFGYLYLKIDFKSKKLYSISVILFLSGTFGNALDRIFYGFVIDFMNFPFLKIPLEVIGLPNFYNNFADMYLFFGLIIFFIDSLKERKNKI
jgi:signal peptidase II